MVHQALPILPLYGQNVPVKNTNRYVVQYRPLDCKEIQPVHSKEDQSWVFIGRTDIEAETPTLWPPDAKS